MLGLFKRRELRYDKTYRTIYHRDGAYANIIDGKDGFFAAIKHAAKYRSDYSPYFSTAAEAIAWAEDRLRNFDYSDVINKRRRSAELDAAFDAARKA